MRIRSQLGNKVGRSSRVSEVGNSHSYQPKSANELIEQRDVQAGIYRITKRPLCDQVLEIVPYKKQRRNTESVSDEVEEEGTELEEREEASDEDSEEEEGEELTELEEGGKKVEEESEEESKEEEEEEEEEEEAEELTGPEEREEEIEEEAEVGAEEGSEEEDGGETEVGAEEEAEEGSEEGAAEEAEVEAEEGTRLEEREVNAQDKPVQEIARSGAELGVVLEKALAKELEAEIEEVSDTESVGPLGRTNIVSTTTARGQSRGYSSSENPVHNTKQNGAITASGYWSRF